MQYKKTKILLAIFLLFTATNVSAQVKLGDLPFNIDDILRQSKILTVKKGFNPVFNIGKYQINKNGILGEKLKGVEILGDIFEKKGGDKILKLYKTYKTGLIVFKVLAATGTAVAAYSTVKGVADSNGFNDKTVKAMLYPALASVATGILTKVITKKASYKAVDIFNGIAKKTIKDIFSVAPASSNIGVGIYVKL